MRSLSPSTYMPANDRAFMEWLHSCHTLLSTLSDEVNEAARSSKGYCAV